MLADRTAFVTGGSQGIGREIALTLADEGANVAVAARGDGIHDTAAAIGDGALAVETDVTDESSVASSVEATVEAFGGLDVLVNNAGIAGPTAPVEEVTVEEWEHTMDVNVTGMFRTVKHAAGHLRDSDAGRVVNVSSISGKRPLAKRTPYAASKMAVIGLTRTLAFEFGDDDVTVNAVCPGATKGPRIEAVIEAQAAELDVSYEEARRRLFTENAALGDLVEAGDVADMVAYLASEKADHVTAEDVNVSAGSVWY
ncbi:SDR family NAD(P)-dependent oxidoreductase [Halobacterium yunchengense]|uniref:SDR family NAD(P)-dependent oxidoreductase n=1 Tax=Halobacterium yunchengense TaxID=3108497 RepID=UPI003AB6721E